MNIYQTEKVSDSLWLIREHYAEDSALVLGLVIGEEKAALIDSGMGLFGTELRELVSGLTDKPTVNILTHGHPDHIGGSVLFDEVYMNERDENQIPRLSKESRMRDAGMFSHKDPELLAYAEAHCLDCSGFQYKNVQNGDTFDLGGITLEILKLPGHSLGSVAVFNSADGYCFVGDAFGERIPASSIKSLEAFAEMADAIQAFTEKVPADTTLFGGHWKKPLSREIILNEMSCARELSLRQTENDEDVCMPMSPIPNQKKHSHGNVWISYNPAILNVPENNK